MMTMFRWKSIYQGNSAEEAAGVESALIKADIKHWRKTKRQKENDLHIVYVESSRFREAKLILSMEDD